MQPFVIGIGLDQSYMNSFGCVGKFYDASSESSFKNILNIVISQALNNTTAQVNLLDVEGRASETDVAMTFYDENSGSHDCALHRSESDVTHNRLRHE